MTIDEVMGLDITFARRHLAAMHIKKAYQLKREQTARAKIK